MRIKETYNLGLNLFFFLYNLAASLNEKRSELLLEWNPCYQALHCATIQVPMNPLDDSSPNIGIFLVKYSPTAKQAEQTLFINPGGPGASASDFVISSLNFLRQLFDDRVEIIAFDPRGVGQTHPIKCGSPRQFNGYKDAFKVFGVPFLPENPSESQKLYFDSAHKLNAKLCDMKFGEFLSYTSTANVARDIDWVRQALGLEKVNFWGISYGGILGLTYANMYPQHTGRMIIDSVANPNAYFLTSIDMPINSLRSSDDTFEAMTNECDRISSCALYNPLKKSSDAIKELLEKLRTQPMVCKECRNPGLLTLEMVEDVIFNSLSTPKKFKGLMEAVLAASNGNSNPLIELAIKRNGPHGDSKLLAIMCADNNDSTHYTLKQWFEKVEQIRKSTSRMGGRQWAWRLLGCRHWKRYQNQERYTGPWNAPLAEKVLIIGNRYDPVTPLYSAKEAKRLMELENGDSNAVLLIQNGFGHGSFAHPSKCTFDYMRNYIFNGVVPPDGTICEPSESLFSTTGSRRDGLIEAAEQINLIN